MTIVIFIVLLSTSHCVWPVDPKHYIPWDFSVKSTMASTRNFQSLPGLCIWSHFSSFNIILILKWTEAFLSGLGTRREISASYCAQDEVVTLSHSPVIRGIFLVWHSSWWVTLVILPKALMWLAFKIPSLIARCFQELHKFSKTQWPGGIAAPLNVQAYQVLASTTLHRHETVHGHEEWQVPLG